MLIRTDIQLRFTATGNAFCKVYSMIKYLIRFSEVQSQTKNAIENLYQF